MEYSNEELTLRIKNLENIIEDLLMQQITSRGRPYITAICVNTALHSRQIDPVDYQEHPRELEVPHYIWRPSVDWGRDMIHLHPLNVPRA